MKKRTALIVIILIIIPVALRQVSRSRTFQFFGEIIPRVNTSQTA